MEMTIARDAAALVRYARAHNLIGNEDMLWTYNAILECIGENGPAAEGADELLAQEGACLLTPACGALACGNADEAAGAATTAPEGLCPEDFDLEGTVERLSACGAANGRDEDTPSGRDRIATRIMDCVSPRPSELCRRVRAAYRRSPEAATDEFYRISCDTRYVRTAAIARNIGWVAPTRWGDLEITINLSKPEKDPRAIAAAGAAPASSEVYPACQLCMENEGYRGRGAGAANGAHPARQNLRIVPIELGGEHWGLQYSPYAYFDEHCIAMSEQHRPMHVDRGNMARLLDFLDLFPHYFVGSNADLPIVGGSILSHDHFQGGRHVFPMMRAEADRTFTLPGLPGVAGEVIRWPLSVLRLTSPRRNDLLDAAERVLSAWRSWSDPELGIVAESDGAAHNTVTPIAYRADDGAYVLCLALRCNITTDEHPLGVFHPHAERHHIKKENIGLIEVMGLAILPPRLVGELDAVKTHLLAADGGAAASAAGRAELLAALEADPLAASHAAWACDLAAAHPELAPDNVEQVLRQGVGEVFGQVLEDAGVYKWDEAGRAGIDRFLAAL